jgi:hypothetical protein
VTLAVRAAVCGLDFWAFHFFMAAHPLDRNQDPAQGARLSVLYCSVFTRNIHVWPHGGYHKIGSDFENEGIYRGCKPKPRKFLKSFIFNRRNFGSDNPKSS